MDPRELRRSFLGGLLTGLRVVWPILSALLGLMIALGLVIGLREGWSVQEAIYFTFVSGLTIGYGDLVPEFLLTRVLAIGIGGVRRAADRPLGCDRRKGIGRGNRGSREMSTAVAWASS